MSREQKQAARVVREQLAKERRRARIRWTAFATAVLLAVAGLVGWGIYRTQKPPSFAMPAHLTNLGGPEGGLVAADEGGAVPVELYLDFFCTTCNQSAAALTPTLNQLLGEKKITLIYHPLDYLSASSTPAGYSMRAASAVGCAADGGKLKAYGEILFTQPPGLTDDQLVDLGGPVGLNAPSFAQCVRAVRYREWVTHVDALATQRGITEAPAVLVAGRKLEAPTPATLIAAVATPS